METGDSHLDHLEHLEDAELEALFASPLREEGNRRGLAHLAAGCGACQARFEEKAERRARELTGEAAYDGPFVAALIRSAAAWRGERAKRATGAALWAGVRESPPGRRATVVLNSRRFRTAGVVEALLRDYHERGRQDPREGLAIAELAVAVAEGLDAAACTPARRADLLGEAEAIAADANRRAGYLLKAARLMGRAAKTLATGSGDPLLQGLLLLYGGGFWAGSQQPEKAVDAYRWAELVYRNLGELHLAAQALVARAEVIGHAHPERGIRLLRRAILEIDGERDRDLELTAHHGLAWYLNDAGRGLAARAEVARSEALYEQSGDAAAALSRAWLEGRIERSLYELDSAGRSYERAAAGFAALDMQIHLAMLTIDRAELQLAAGEPAAAAELLDRALALARGLGTAVATERALLTLREAVAAGRCGRTGFRQVALTLRRTWATA